MRKVVYGGACSLDGFALELVESRAMQGGCVLVTYRVSHR
jgi:hypothetical protein